MFASEFVHLAVPIPLILHACFLRVGSYKYLYVACEILFCKPTVTNFAKTGNSEVISDKCNLHKVCF